MGRPIRNAGGLCDTSEGLMLFKMRLKKPEALHRQFAGFIRESGQLVHTHGVCQIMLTTLCQIMLKVT